ncbi:hypothetical protein OUZ56_015950 [Daphnia magna]|uniref:Uncharacterized protein n=1 Tax=Daphnia magna TaxID=35525 RepID=A0ABR0APA4_9CRUS|nr:hypothetical protein OUZ56_015950 [Daphnia magna]
MSRRKYEFFCSMQNVRRHVCIASFIRVARQILDFNKQMAASFLPLFARERRCKEIEADRKTSREIVFIARVASDALP